MRRAVAVPLTVVVALAVGAGATAGLDAAGVVDTGLLSSPPAASPTPRPTATIPAPRAAGAVLPAVGTTAPAPASASVAARLDAALRVPALGAGVSATVIDPATGTVVYDRDGATPRTPASVTKLATARAALTELGADARIATRVVAGATPGELVLVGGGDPTLTARPQAVGAYPQWASLQSLVDQVVAHRSAATPTPGESPSTATPAPGASPSAASATPVTVRVDDSAFTGPAVSPTWPATYTTSGIVAPVMALTVDEGRIGDTGSRSPDPALAAGEAFARLLRKAGVPVTGAVTRTSAPAGAAAVATVRSPTVAVLVEHMLTESDNDLAEHLARLAAKAAGRPASFAGVGPTVTAAATFSDLPPPGGFSDGSGLSRANLVSSGALAELLSRAADRTSAELRPILTGLSVAGFNGTLAERFDGSGDARGVVRAKTGTLTGVTSLAGAAVDRDGRLLVFAFIVNDVTNTVSARAALDDAASALAGCGCG